MANLQLPHGEVIQAPDGLTDAEYDAIVDNYYSSGGAVEESSPGVLDKVAAWSKSEILDPAMMNMLDATFGGKTLGKIAADTLASGGSPADIKSNIVSSIPAQLGKTVLNTVGGAGATLADLGLNLPQYGIKAADTLLQSTGITESATSGAPEDVQVIINPLTGQPVKVSAQGTDYSEDAKYLLDLFKGPQEKVQEFHKGLREDTPLISRNPIAETTTDLAAKGSDWLGEQAGIPAELNPATGAIKSVGGLAGGLLTPENAALALPTLGQGAVAQISHKLLPALFGPAAIEGAGTEAGATVDQLQQGNISGATEHGLNTVLQGLMGAAMLKSLVPKGGGTSKAPPPTPQELLDRAAPDMVGAPVPPGPTPPGAPITIESNIPRGDLRLPTTDMSVLAGQGILPDTLPGAGPSAVVPPRVQVVPGTTPQAYVTPPKRVMVSGKPVPSAPSIPADLSTKFGLPTDIITTMANMLQGQKFTPELQAALKKMEKAAPSGRGVRSTATNPKLRMVVDPVTPLLEPVLGKLKKKADESKLTLPPFLGGVTRIEKQREAFEQAIQEVSPELTKRVGDYTTKKTSSYIEELRQKITDEINETIPDNIQMENVRKRLDALDRGELPESQKLKLQEDIKQFEDVQRAELLGPAYQKHMKAKGFKLGEDTRYRDDLRSSGPTGRIKSYLRNVIPEFAEADRNTGQEGALLLDLLNRGDNKKSYFRGRLIATLDKPVNALRKMKIDDRQMTNWLEFVESTPDGGVRWNPEAHLDANGNVKIAAFKGEPPSPKAMEHLASIRKSLDKINADLVSQGFDIGYYSRYVPRESLIPGELPAGQRSVLAPSFTRERAWREGEPMERRLGHLLDSYVNRVAKLENFSPELISRIADQALKYEWLGDTNRAKVFRQIAEETLGIGEGGVDKLQREYLKKYWKENGEPALLQEMKRLGLEGTTLDKVLEAARDLTAKSLIGLNPRQILAQKLDPILRGSPDVPIAKLLDTFRGYTAAEKAMLERVHDTLRTDVWDPFSVDEAKGLASKGGQFGYKLLGKPGEPGTKLVDVIEGQERNRVFVAAHRWWKQTADKDTLFKTMNESDLQTVRDAMKKGGDDLAAEEFARLKVNQVMGIYGKTNRPIGMRSGIGKMSMFTTFSRHELNKLWDDINAKRYGMAARRFINPMIPALLAGSVASIGNDKGVLENALYFHPMGAVVSSGSVNSPPYIQVPAQVMRQAGANGLSTIPKTLIKETAKLTPTTRLISGGLSMTIDDKAGSRGRVRRKGRERKRRSR